MKVTKKDLENVAVLSRLAIPADKEEQYTNQLNDVLTYMENLNSINTADGIYRTSYPKLPEIQK